MGFLWRRVIGKCSISIVVDFVRRLVMVASRWEWVAGCGAVILGNAVADWGGRVWLARCGVMLLGNAIADC